MGYSRATGSGSVEATDDPIAATRLPALFQSHWFWFR